MKKAAIWAGILILLVIVGRLGLGYMFTSGEANSARERVRRVLDGLKGGDRQRAVTLWKSGSLHVGSQQEFDEAAGRVRVDAQAPEIDPIVDYEIRR